MYLAVKHTHLTLVVLSIVLFYYRFYINKIKGQPLNKFNKVVPHVIDSLLLISAGVLCVLIAQYPFVAQWLTFKVICVIGYIVFAFLAMKSETKINSINWLSASSICLILAGYFAVTKGIT